MFPVWPFAAKGKGATADDRSMGVTGGRSASEPVYGECERARNGEANLYGRADDGATKSPPRKTGPEGSKSRQGPPGGPPWSRGGPSAGAVKAPALAGCRGCVRMETRWTGSGTGPVPGRDGLPALCEA